MALNPGERRRAIQVAQRYGVAAEAFLTDAFRNCVFTIVVRAETGCCVYTGNDTGSGAHFNAENDTLGDAELLAQEYGASVDVIFNHNGEVFRHIPA